MATWLNGLFQFHQDPEEFFPGGADQFYGSTKKLYLEILVELDRVADVAFYNDRKSKPSDMQSNTRFVLIGANELYRSPLLCTCDHRPGSSTKILFTRFLVEYFSQALHQDLSIENPGGFFIGGLSTRIFLSRILVEGSQPDHPL